MKKLFDETYVHHGKNIHSRTIWYGFIEAQLNQQLLLELKQLMMRDLGKEASVEQTSWIFYFKETMSDAIGQTVRQSLMIRKEQEKFYINFNYSDFGFVTSYLEVEKFCRKLKQYLNQLEVKAIDHS